LSVLTDEGSLTDEDFYVDRGLVDIGQPIREDAAGRPTEALLSNAMHRWAKRALDIVISAIGLLALLPIIGVVAFLILIESGRPILFRCPRVGRDGEPFAMLKFRKMRDGVTGLPLTTASDGRYTRAGRWLTKTKLDELPQLWNVLCGQMALVGPRPEDPQFVAERPEDYARILRCKQGITGLSQLAFYEEAEILDPDDPMTHYRSSIWPQKIRLDHLYVTRATIWWDLRILAWTVLRFLLRRPVVVDWRTGRISLLGRQPVRSAQEFA
jgi:lipopolysaccharide/colanic/teichoic acid biosynthesis glycosyltransferase